jgi:hypothetical protein
MFGVHVVERTEPERRRFEAMCSGGGTVQEQLWSWAVRDGGTIRVCLDYKFRDEPPSTVSPSRIFTLSEATALRDALVSAIARAEQLKGVVR